MPRCPESEALAAWAEGSTDVDRDAIRCHVQRCGPCSEAAASVLSCELGEGWRTRTFANRYLLQTLLDQGGRGVICVARDLVLGRRVAIKLARRDEDSSALLREAATQAAFHHPNVLSVLDAGQDHEHAFVVVEYVDGEDGATACLAPGFTDADAHRIISDAARGLSALHRAQQVHGDVTPRNLVVGHDGRTRLLDFGLATTTLEGGGGTPGFVAPEQRTTGSTPLTDQYGLGKTLAYLLLHTTTRSAALERVVRRACDRDPYRRYPSVAALANALRRPRLRNTVPAVAVMGLAALALPEQPRDLDAYFMGRIEEAVDIAVFEHDAEAIRAHLRQASTIAARTGRPELEVRAALLAATATDSDVTDTARHELALTAVRLAEGTSDQGLRTEALLALSTSPTLTLDSSKVLVELADASAESLPPAAPQRAHLDIAHMIFDLDDPTASPPVVQGDTAPIAALARLYRGFGEPGWTVEDVGCEAVERTYPRGLCYSVQAWAYVSSTEGLLATTGSKVARRYADLSLDTLGWIPDLDDCDLQLGLFVRATTRLDTEPEAAEADLRRANEVCSDHDEPEHLVMLRAQWARSLVRTGNAAVATRVLDSASALGVDTDDARTLVGVARQELRQATAAG